ncbi:TlpA family protein disulfide reductase [Georgenia yuyongxinii]
MTGLAADREPEAGPSPRRAGLRWLRWGSAVVVATVVGIGALFGARLDRDPTLVSTPLIGQPASKREVPYLEQDEFVSLSDLRGEIVVVNFWASWCVACRQEHPSLGAAASAYQDAGVRFLGVNYQDQKSSATAFLDEMGRGENFTYLSDPGSRLAIDFGVFGVPETFFIDTDGRIAAKITGPANLPLLSGVLDEMLAGGRPDESTTTGPVQGRP